MKDTARDAKLILLDQVNALICAHTGEFFISAVLTLCPRASGAAPTNLIATNWETPQNVKHAIKRKRKDR